MELSKEAAFIVRELNFSTFPIYFHILVLEQLFFVAFGMDTVMISRTLGPEFGGAIGTLFFFANIVGSALAISGCSEGIVQNLGPGGQNLIPDGQWWRFLYCTLVNTLMLIVCLVGASLFAKTNVLIFGAVIVCLISTFVSFITQGELQVRTLDVGPYSNVNE